MKCKLVLLMLVCGLSFTVQAKFFNYEKPGIKCAPEKMMATKDFDFKLPTPKYVFAEGEYHPITSKTYPFYTTHNHSTVVESCYNPNTPAPLGSLWMQSLSESSYAFKSSSNNNWASFSFNYNIDVKPAHKLCSGCKRPVSKPSAAFHLKNSEKLVYYFNGM